MGFFGVPIVEVIADFGERIGSGRTARVDTKYKTVDRKVRPVVAPLPEGSECCPVDDLLELGAFRSGLQYANPLPNLPLEGSHSRPMRVQYVEQSHVHSTQRGHTTSPTS